MTRSTEEILDALEQDGILTVGRVLVETSEAVVEIDGNVGRVVEWLGVHRQFAPFAGTLRGILAKFQDEAWVHGQDDRADELAIVGFEIGTRWGTYPVVCRAMNVHRPGWGGRPVTVNSRCGIHGCPTSTGRCAKCDEENVVIGAQARGEVER